MKQVSLSGESRAHVGKTDAKANRLNGKVPAVVYGGAQCKNLLVDYKELTHIIYSPDTYLVNINVDGATLPTVIKEIQFHPVTDKILHIDFYELLPGKEVTVQIPLKFTGNSPGVLQGGKLTKSLRKVRVKATAEKMPELVEVKLDNLGIGQTLKIKDIVLEGAKIIETPERAVASVVVTRNSQSQAAAAADAKGAKKK